MILVGDRWVQLGQRLMRIHTLPRTSAYTPQLEDWGPDVSTLNGMRTMFKSFARGHITTITDDWTIVVPYRDSHPSSGTTTFLAMGPLADQGVPSSRVESQIADTASSRPWDGDEPPLSICVDAAPLCAVLIESGAGETQVDACTR